MSKKMLDSQIWRAQSFVDKEFHNMGTILLDMIWNLLMNVEINSKEFYNRVLRYLMKCEECFSECRKSLQSSEFDLCNIYNTIFDSMEIYEVEESILGTYIASFKETFRVYVKNQGYLCDKHHMEAAKQTLGEFFVKNKAIAQLAIEMLEKHNQELNNLDGIVSLELQSSSSSSKDTASCCSKNKRLTGGKTRRKRKKISFSMPSDSSQYFVQEVKRMQMKRKTVLKDAEDWMSLAASSEESKIQTATMKETASYIIDILLTQKLDSKSAKFEALFNVRNMFDIELGDIWIDLCELHNQLMQNKQKSEDIKTSLMTFYLIKMQTLVHKDLDLRLYSDHMKSTVSRSEQHSISSTMGPVLKRNTLPQARLCTLHKQFYNTQREKIRETETNFNARKFYNLIINHEVPQSRSEHDLFNEYGKDPEHCNILMIPFSHDSHHEYLLKVIKQNYENILNLIEREKRHEHMIYGTIGRHTIDRPWKAKQDVTLVLPKAPQSTTIFLEDYIKRGRLKWIKYFAKQEKPITERNLENALRQSQDLERKQKLAERKKNRLERRKYRQTLRPLVCLYEAPRLTHRLRRAMEQIAQDKRFDLTTKNDARKYIENESVEQEQDSFSADLLEFVSCTSCCSNCRPLRYETTQDSTLERFHRTEAEILAQNNVCLD